MRVSLAEVQRYARTLAALSDVAEERASASIALWMSTHPDASVAECREFAIAAVKSAVARYGDAAARNAASLYDETMEREGMDVPPATVYDGPDDDAIDGTVRRHAGRLAGGEPDREGFARQLGRYAADRTRDAARQTVVRNVGRDSATRKGRGVRFARIPQRPDPCGWCVMLASRGFDYTGEDEAAAASHHNCTCLVMSGVNGKTKVDGYDPEGMYDRYDTCRKAIEHDIEAERRRLQAAGAYDADAFNEWCKQRIVAEMNTRDRRWLKTGTPCFRTKERGARPEKKERDVATCLLMQGFNVRFARERPPKKRFDAWLNGERYEFKVPEAYNEKTVKNQFKKALGKGTDKLLISATKNGASLEDLASDVRQLFNEGEFAEIREVLLLSADGEVTMRVKRPLPES